MKTNRLFFAILLIIFIYTACKDNKQNENETKELEYKIEKFNKLAIKDDTTGRNAKIDLEYPVFTSGDSLLVKRLNRMVQSMMFASIYESENFTNLDDFANNFIKTYLAFRKENETAVASWEITRKIEVSYPSAKYLTLRYEEYSFSGGAHGSNTIFYNLVNRKNRRVLAPEDVVKPENIEKLTYLVYKYFLVARNLPANTDLAAEGFWFTDNKFTITDNFGYVDGFYIFYYNPYEVAPYAWGPTEVKIPEAEIEPLLKNEPTIVNKK